MFIIFNFFKKKLRLYKEQFQVYSKIERKMQRLFLYSLYPHCTVYPIAKKHCPFFDFFYERKKYTSILFKPLFVFLFEFFGSCYYCS